MKILQRFSALLLIAVLVMTGCKPNDSKIKLAVEQVLKAKAETAATTADVKAGVVTLSGTLASEAAKKDLEAAVKNVADVKSVVNNIQVNEVTVPVELPVISEDAALEVSLMDALKDNPSVRASVLNGVVTLSGDIARTDLPALMMKINSLKPKKINNNLTVK
jgi:hyperosmotically inducible protein